jgi:hypothetical protein
MVVDRSSLHRKSPQTPSSHVRHGRFTLPFLDFRAARRSSFLENWWRSAMSLRG